MTISKLGVGPLSLPPLENNASGPSPASNRLETPADVHSKVLNDIKLTDVAPESATISNLHFRQSQVDQIKQA
jgi:hypothetical protein